MQLPKFSAGIDPNLQQKLIDQHRRNIDEIDAQMQHQKDRANAELQVRTRNIDEIDAQMQH